MTTSETGVRETEAKATTDWIGMARALGPALAARAGEHDVTDAFVAENYAALKQEGFFKAGIPAELGGGGAAYADLCGMIRELAHHCSSTALAASMHTHVVAMSSYLWRSGNKLPEPLLRRIAAEGLIMVSSGGSDWLAGSGRLEKVEGGYLMTGRKIFGSGSPAGHLLMTTGIYDDPTDGPTVIHFPLPLAAPGVRVLDTWRAMGMRGTGSHDIELESVFLPDAMMGGVRRPAGKWHGAVHVSALVALPIIYAAYLGVAEAARDLALGLARKKRNDPNLAYLVGELENQLVLAQIAHASMVELSISAKPGPDTSSAMLVRRTILANAALRTVDKAMEVAGGGAFFRSAQLERLFRDVQACRYHPLPEKQQTRLTGRLLLGLDIDG
jgi:alkylation response protein AidB-like acyl-CoA dehydrogenase